MGMESSTVGVESPPASIDMGSTPLELSFSVAEDSSSSTVNPNSFLRRSVRFSRLGSGTGESMKF